VLDLLASTDHSLKFGTPGNRHLAAFDLVGRTFVLCRSSHNEQSCEEVEVGQNVGRHLGGIL
jgi:hypothetical protein